MHIPVFWSQLMHPGTKLLHAVQSMINMNEYSIELYPVQ